MQNTELNPRDISLLYEGMVDMINHSELGIKATQAVLTKVLVLLALSSGANKQEFLDQLEYVWEFENFF
ncbi:MAG: hypothetical protein LW632_11920, partial [Burkholderiaceae bacterium]|nr:hypothetical protein [Burkholderiaceae bacterium]